MQHVNIRAVENYFPHPVGWKNQSD